MLEKGKPFTLRYVCIDLNELFDFATDPDGISMTVLQFVKAIQKGDTTVPYIKRVTEEARNYSEKKRIAGRAGGLAKSSSAKQCQDLLEQNVAEPSIPLANNNNSNNNKKKKPSCRQPSGDHQLFLAWWCMSYERITGNKYLVQGKDAKHVKQLLAGQPLTEIISKACALLLSADKFYDDKKDLSMLMCHINRIPRVNGDDIDLGREEGIIPPKGVTFMEWKFWEASNG